MIPVPQRLAKMLEECTHFFQTASDKQTSQPIAPGKWSRRQILGHLIDSALNNLQRFTEIQFLSGPYKVRRYQQNDLVQTNDYQNASTGELLILWRALNTRIMHVITAMPDQVRQNQIITPEGELHDLEFLITDYADHMEHHLRQILG